MRRARVVCTAACASGVTTPITGSEKVRCSAGSAAAVAVLQATTTSFTPCSSSQAVISEAKARSSASECPP